MPNAPEEKHSVAPKPNTEKEVPQGSATQLAKHRKERMKLLEDFSIEELIEILAKKINDLDNTTSPGTDEEKISSIVKVIVQARKNEATTQLGSPLGEEDDASSSAVSPQSGAIVRCVSPVSERSLAGSPMSESRLSTVQLLELEDQERNAIIIRRPNFRYTVVQRVLFSLGMFQEELPLLIDTLFNDLFEKYPLAKEHLGKISPGRKCYIMQEFFDIVVYTTTRPDMALPSLRQIAETHRSLDVGKPEQLREFGKALIGAIANVLGNRFSPQMKAAWHDVYAWIADALVKLTTCQENEATKALAERFKKEKEMREAEVSATALAAAGRKQAARAFARDFLANNGGGVEPLTHDRPQEGRALEFSVFKKGLESIDLSHKHLDSCLTYGFNIFEIVHEFGPGKAQIALCKIVMHIFNHTGLLKKFGITHETFTNFLFECRLRYRPNVMYHNWFHAVDVFHTIYTFLHIGEVEKQLNDVECLIILLSALVHDLQHGGFNNGYHLKTESGWGILSTCVGNNSVMEMRHCSLAVEILEATGLLESLPEDQQPHALRTMIEVVLATDMARHNELVTQFKEMLPNAKSFDKANAEHRKMVMIMLMKMGDISNVVKPFDVAKNWGETVTNEFYNQGDMERKRGMNPIPIFDRTLNQSLAQGQIGFISFLAAPFFKSMVANFFEKCHWCLDNIDLNVEIYKEMVELEKEKKAGEEAKKEALKAMESTKTEVTKKEEGAKTDDAEKNKKAATAGETKKPASP